MLSCWPLCALFDCAVLAWYGQSPHLLVQRPSAPNVHLPPPLSWSGTCQTHTYVIPLRDGPPVPLVCVCVLLPAGSLAQYRLHARAGCGAARKGGGVWPCDRLLHHGRLPGGVWCPVVHHEELADGQLAGTAKCGQLAVLAHAVCLAHGSLHETVSSLHQMPHSRQSGS